MQEFPKQKGIHHREHRGHRVITNIPTPSFRRTPDRGRGRRRNPELLESRSERDWIPGRVSLAGNDGFLLLSRVLQETKIIENLNVSSTKGSGYLFVFENLPLRAQW